MTGNAAIPVQSVPRFAGTALVGGLVWVVGMAVARPAPFDVAWAHALLLFGPLVIVPLGLQHIAPSGEAGNGRPWRILGWMLMPAALLLGAAYMVPQGWLSAALALPWLAALALLALHGLVRVRQRGLGPLAELCLDAACLYVPVGAAWAVADRLAFRPLDLDPVIVLLTGIHFHYAGFALPLVTGLALRRLRGPLPMLAGAGVLLGVPAVAAGITATQLGLGPAVECAAATLLAAAGLLVAWLHLRLAVAAGQPVIVRVLWILAALALAGSMLLAALYGWRAYAPIEELDIPFMRAFHGTANALGFGLGGLLAWAMARD